MDVAKWLLKYGAHVDAQNAYGWSTLIWASKVGAERLFYANLWPGRLQTCQWLVSHGALTNRSDTYGLTPLLWAAQRGQDVKKR